MPIFKPRSQAPRKYSCTPGNTGCRSVSAITRARRSMRNAAMSAVGIDMLLKITVEIEMVARPADQIGPDVQVKLPPVGGEDFLPGQ